MTRGRSFLALAGVLWHWWRCPPPRPPRSRPTRASTRSSGPSCAAPTWCMRRPFGLRAGPVGSPAAWCCAPATRSTASAPGPAELFGVRSSRMFMKARQRDLPARPGASRSASPPARGCTSSSCPRQRSYWKFFHAAQFDLCRLTADGSARQARAPRPEGQLLPARPRAHPPAQGSLAGAPIYPACNTSSRTRKVRARHLGRLVGRLPARLPRAVDRRDRPARLLRLRAHRRPAQRHLRVQRAQQLVDGGGPAAVPGRPPALSRGPRRPGSRTPATTTRATRTCDALRFDWLMAKTLVVAEKPSVARDLAGALPGSLQAVQGQDQPRGRRLRDHLGGRPPGGPGRARRVRPQAQEVALRRPADRARTSSSSCPTTTGPRSS